MKKKLLIGAFVVLLTYLVYRWVRGGSSVSNDAGTPLSANVVSAGAYGSVAKTTAPALNVQSLGGGLPTGFTLSL